MIIVARFATGAEQAELELLTSLSLLTHMRIRDSPLELHALVYQVRCPLAMVPCKMACVVSFHFPSSGGRFALKQLVKPSKLLHSTRYFGSEMPMIYLVDDVSVCYQHGSKPQSRPDSEMRPRCQNTCPCQPLKHRNHEVLKRQVLVRVVNAEAMLGRSFDAAVLSERDFLRLEGQHPPVAVLVLVDQLSYRYAPPPPSPSPPNHAPIHLCDNKNRTLHPPNRPIPPRNSSHPPQTRRNRYTREESEPTKKKPQKWPPKPRRHR